MNTDENKAKSFEAVMAPRPERSEYFVEFHARSIIYDVLIQHKRRSHNVLRAPTRVQPSCEPTLCPNRLSVL